MKYYHVSSFVPLDRRVAELLARITRVSSLPDLSPSHGDPSPFKAIAPLNLPQFPCGQGHSLFGYANTATKALIALQALPAMVTGRDLKGLSYLF